MKLVKLSIAALCLAWASGCSTPEAAAPAAAPAPAPAPAPAAAPRGETVVATVEVTATVTAINHATREVTLKKDDGTEVTFVASEDVKNLPQVKVGDVLHVVYAEALAYEVRKGGTTAAPATAIAGGAAENTASAKSIPITAATPPTMHATTQLNRAKPLTSVSAAPTSGATIISNGACARTRSR